MKTRPWPIVLLAFLQWVTPLFNILFNAFILNVGPAQILKWLFNHSSLEIFENLALMPIAGVAIFVVRPWSYPVFFGAMFWSMASNFKHYAAAQAVLPLWSMVLVYGGELALVIYFLLPKVRMTYFDPDVRWWETKPRYELKVPVEIQNKENLGDGILLNLSQGGAFVGTTKKWHLNDALKLNFLILTHPFEVSGTIVHERSLDKMENCYGVKFNHSLESQEAIARLTRGLQIIGFQDRARTPVFLKEFALWLSTLIQTGKGWQPEPKKRGK